MPAGGALNNWSTPGESVLPDGLVRTPNGAMIATYKVMTDTGEMTLALWQDTDTDVYTYGVNGLDEAISLFGSTGLSSGPNGPAISSAAARSVAREQAIFDCDPYLIVAQPVARGSEPASGGTQGKFADFYGMGDETSRKLLAVSSTATATIERFGNVDSIQDDEVDDVLDGFNVDWS